MTPQQRAEAILTEWIGAHLLQGLNRVEREHLAELIRQAIVAATNDELERRRCAEAERDAVQAAMQRLIHGGGAS